MGASSESQYLEHPRRISVSGIDVCICFLIIGLGALPFFLFERAPGFINADVHYVDLADSLLHSHSYSANFTPERVHPPGLPLILAGFCATISCTHDVLTRTMPMFFTLGLVLAYEVVRRQSGRFIAACSCLIAASSPAIFPWVTSRLWPIFPYYFFVTMVIFLLIAKLQRSQSVLHTLLWIAALGLLLTIAVALESIALALVLAILGWLLFTFLRSPGSGRLRLRRFLPIVLIALLAEGVWLSQGGNLKDWPLPGFPESYLSQLKIKNGNDPEAGFATPKDLAIRVDKNLKDSTIFLVTTLIPRWINPSWTSPVIAGALLLILCGLGRSLFRDETQLCAMYFIFYEGVCLLWPWFVGEVRFGAAVFPLALMYFAEGILALYQWSRERPQMVGVLLLPCFAALAIAAAWEGWARFGGLQEKSSTIVWLGCAVVCVGLVWKKTLSNIHVSSVCHLFGREDWTAILSLRSMQLAVAVVVAYLVVTGCAAEITTGRENLISGPVKMENTPEIQAAGWIAAHTDPNAIVASSQVDLIYHYSGRQVIWFPPISNPKVLMDGIREHRIQYIVVISRRFNYYIPSETTCFGLLGMAYPGSFRLVDNEGPVKIYQVLSDVAARS